MKRKMSLNFRLKLHITTMNFNSGLKLVTPFNTVVI